MTADVEKRLAKLAEKKAQIVAQERLLKNKISKQQRAKETKAKIILGALAKSNLDQTTLQSLVSKIEKDIDRKVVEDFLAG